jgi:hypothetical protein
VVASNKQVEDLMNRQSKLAELRAKTDRQLVTLIRSRLDDGLASARASAAETCAEAKRAYSEVRVLLPAVRDVTEAERRRLESKLARLRELLDEQPVHAVARVGESGRRGGAAWPAQAVSDRPVAG